MKRFKVGVFGAMRGTCVAAQFMLLNCDIVAICDRDRVRAEKAAEGFPKGVAIYEDFDSFIEHDMDIVILGNDFHQKTPYAIRCMEKNLHIYCETTSNSTMAEGVALARAAKNSKSIFMLAENYPWGVENREMQRVAKSGALGRILYCEGEYNHPIDPIFNRGYWRKGAPYPEHWRRHLPRSYYMTHSLAPVMAASGATPKRVTAFACFCPVDESIPSGDFQGDKVTIVLTQNDDGSVFRVTGCAGMGAESSSFRICGTKGQIENPRGLWPNVMLRYNHWEVPEGKEAVNLYTPVWRDEDEEHIAKAGHGGGDYLIAREFMRCVREGVQPPFPYDLHSAIAMSNTAILSHRSMLDGGKPYDIPDFRLEEDCLKYENDNLSPFYGMDGSEPTLPCCSVPDYAPTEAQQKAHWDYIHADIEDPKPIQLKRSISFVK